MEKCSKCQRSFGSTHALHAHCRNKDNHPFCKNCNTLFSLFAELVQHMQNAEIHQADREQKDTSDSDDKHNWCLVCSLDFPTERSLEQHLFSVHKGLEFECPLCTRKFKKPSSIAQHIESGIHGVSRAQVTAAVNALDIVPTISISRRIEDQTPAIVTYYATEKTFNGTAYECYLCHDTFRTLNSLNSHVNSAAHDADEFKCPKCKGEYKLVSALMHHIESQACGIAKFQEVVTYTNDLIEQFKDRLTIK